MSLEKGFRLGPYEIQSQIGAGGMGEVYRAQDTRLNRIVAVKVLPSRMVGHGQMVERFDREAKAISSLQHPNICALYDVGHDQGLHYLVMEHLEGESLAARLTGGTLDPQTAIQYGIQIAQALDAAHRAGIVHRDLKPGNIMITKDGLKLLDFGLAKVSETPSYPGSATVPGASGMQTETLPQTPLTQEGTILGTFQYMSPEQLEGKEADNRTDIFALGAILYEMITGHRAFVGDSQASLIAAIMSQTPRAVSEFQAMCPPALDSVIRTCLAKNAEDRWQTAHDVALQLKWISEGGSAAGVPAVVSTRRKSRELVAWVVAVLALVGVAAMAASLWLGEKEPGLSTMRFQVEVPGGISRSTNPHISPDGRAIAYIAADSTETQRIWIHRLNALEPQPVPGTETARRPFWSPDSRHLAFFTEDGKLKKIALAGGPPLTIGEAKGGADGTWGANGIILFDKTTSDSVESIPATGGNATPATVIDRSRGETGTVWPQFLPDGEHFLFLALGTKPEDAVLKVAKLGSMESKVVGEVGTRFQFVNPGYVLFVRSGILVCQRFNTDSHELEGDPVPIAEDVTYGGVNFSGSFSASNNGVLVFWNNSVGGQSRLRWFDRAGNVLDTVHRPDAFTGFQLAPDESKVLAAIVDPATNTNDLWILDLNRGAKGRFTFDEGDDRTGAWLPDGSAVILSSDRGRSPDVYRKSATGAGSTELLFGEIRAAEFPFQVTDDGQWIVYGDFESGTRLNVRARPLNGSDSDRVTIAATNYQEHGAQVSPNGKWVAYQSDETGRFEVYVQAFPEPTGKWQISTDTGASPRWSPDGAELFYLDASRVLMRVGVDTGQDVFRAEIPEPLFRAPVVPSFFEWSRFQPSRDGKRFLMLSPITTTEVQPITVVVNWLEELEIN